MGPARVLVIQDPCLLGVPDIVRHVDGSSYNVGIWSLGKPLFEGSLGFFKGILGSLCVYRKVV